MLSYAESSLSLKLSEFASPRISQATSLSSYQSPLMNKGHLRSNLKSSTNIGSQQHLSKIDELLSKKKTPLKEVTSLMQNTWNTEPNNKRTKKTSESVTKLSMGKLRTNNLHKSKTGIYANENLISKRLAE